MPRSVSCYIKEMDEIKVLDVVAVTEDAPDYGLRRGEVGTVVERWKDGAFEVEFSNDSGRLMLLRLCAQTN